MGQEDILKRIKENNAHGEELVKFIEQRIPALRKAMVEQGNREAEANILAKNKLLKAQLEFFKKRVIELEMMNGIEQYSLPDKDSKEYVSSSNSSSNKLTETVVSKPTAENTKEEPSKESKKSGKQPKETKKEKSEKPAKSEKQASDEGKEIDVSRLDLRIGRILSAKKHPDAESLYVEDIDVGEDKPRTVVSGLVKFVPLEEMQNRLVVVLCNLKPAKMRGITSEAMVMCASTPDKVEILCPPADCVPGDKVVCDEYPGEPDQLLPPKKKIFEQVAPDLKTNKDFIATYKSAQLKVVNKGVIKSLTLAEVQIK
ncbi:aminoacyl tRNA synthase complex-interacting multifunctional protein 1 isoform X2 [Parasteatoda tepidariorum]|uniref:Aminoacyl tRNA synthase complex-interacting multifunctional protein 1 n=2 Tax=Parasteatoda tepidariorum TaxID=114398 RepID=A0A2L2Y6A9_PARTP|nr:aminoacyl tRNA synthase complex-interacting multifunctional protein 1 isoform X2 [Parasteatoda tepidariorum]